MPGRPLFYATAMTLGGAAVGLLVESHLGRPTKIEGNPDHPASRGATEHLSSGGGAVALRSRSFADGDLSGPVAGPGTRRPSSSAMRRSKSLSTAAVRGCGIADRDDRFAHPRGQLEALLADLPEADGTSAIR